MQAIFQNHVNRLFFEPMVSFGIHTHISFASRRTGNELAAAHAFIGAVSSYGIGNLSKDSGEAIHPGYKIAMRWSCLLVSMFKILATVDTGYPSASTRTMAQVIIHKFA